MHELDDNALLRQYAEQNSETAFAALVTRHVDKVYSTALRHTRNASAAGEITQAVFVILAKKSGRLGGKVILAGWLYETARLTALTFIRSEIRRARREQEAHMQTALNENESEAWPHIAPLLDDALAGLSAADRHAIVLRYFDGKSLGEVGAALGASEDAAKKRVTRAVEKLRGYFTKRGVTLTATVLTAAISANSVQAAPLGLAATVTATAVKGTLISATITTLVNTTMKTMTWLKIKFVAGVGIAALLAGGAATVAVLQTSKSDDGLTPQQIAKQSQEAYAALTSYSDNGATISTIGPTSVTNTFHIRLQRPDFYRIDWSQLIAPGVTYSKGVVWSAGDGHFMQMSSSTGDVYPQPNKSAGRQQNLGAAAGVSSWASSTIPGAFFGEQTVGEQTGNASLRLVLMGATKLNQEPDAIVGGVDCHVFTSKLDPSTRPGGGKLPNNMVSIAQATTTFWIGKKDHLIRQTRMVMDTSHMTMPKMSDEQIKNILGKTGKPVTIEAVAAMRKIMEGGQRQLSSGNITYLETHENIVVNRKFSAADFAR